MGWYRLFQATAIIISSPLLTVSVVFVNRFYSYMSIVLFVVWAYSSKSWKWVREYFWKVHEFNTLVSFVIIIFSKTIVLDVNVLLSIRMAEFQIGLFERLWKTQLNSEENRRRKSFTAEQSNNSSQKIATFAEIVKKLNICIYIYIYI